MVTTMLRRDTVPEYILGRPALAALISTDGLVVEEIGDGNLNQVFTCRDVQGRGLVLKQALPYVRLVGPGWPMTEDRAAREAQALSIHGSLSPDWVCRLISYDEEHHVLALEDLTDHEVLRTRLNRGGPYQGAFTAMARLTARVLFGTSWLGLGEEGFRHQATATVNSELCRITEDLVFTDPFVGSPRNGVRMSVEKRKDALLADSPLLAGAMRMKRRFLSVQEALIHGDLHTGSIFVRGGSNQSALSVKAFDSEFAFYGPIGFDLGCMWGNILAAAARAAALGQQGRAEALVSEIALSWRAFETELRSLWTSRVNPERYEHTFLDSWLADILDDSWGFAGAEVHRRVIGLAKVSDIETLDDSQYEHAVDIMLTVGRIWLVERSSVDFATSHAAFSRMAAWIRT